MPHPLSEIVTMVAHGRHLCSPSFGSMAQLSDQRCSHRGKGVNTFVTMGWSAGQVHAVGLALGEVGLASNHAADFGEVGLGRHCIEGLGWHSGRHSFRCTNAVGRKPITLGGFRKNQKNFQ